MTDDTDVIGRRMLAALIDMVVLFALKRRQRLGDMAAGTLVARG